jgi:hypothetical protein
VKPHRRHRRRLDPFTKEERSALEILAMLAGRTNYTVPTEGKSTKGPGLTALDVAHAISASSEKLGAAIGLAVACQRDWDAGMVQELGYERLLREFHRQRAMPGVAAGALRYRVRLVLADAFRDLIWPQQRPSYRAAAKNRGIQAEIYRFMHRYATGKLDEYANTAAKDACTFLFAPMAQAREWFEIREQQQYQESLVLADGDGRMRVVHADSPHALFSMIANKEPVANEIDWLLDEMLKPGAHQRTLGVLTLQGRAHVAVYVQETTK